ncbi:MAG: DUF3710 domain-containing protein [Propionibacteriaceae bacterium]|nr:DUF3710 domain-containing protein [Propionibacteriaceae bacterium]
MIFRRQAKAEPATDQPALQSASPASSDGFADRRPPVDQWEALDRSQDWRQDGPFDITEVDLGADDIGRLDLGALIVTPEPDLKVQIVLDPKTKTAASLIVVGPPGSLQVQVLAAPDDPGFAAEQRERLLAEAEAAEAPLELVAGPFGTELRGLSAVVETGGAAVGQPVRQWLIAGPRWLLSARLSGRAALDLLDAGPAGELEEVLRNLVVRRGDVALVPGTPVPLRPPGQPDQPDQPGRPGRSGRP